MNRGQATRNKKKKLQNLSSSQDQNKEKQLLGIQQADCSIRKYHQHNHKFDADNHHVLSFSNPT